MKKFKESVQKLLKGLCVSVFSVVCVLVLNTATVNKVMADEKNNL